MVCAPFNRAGIPQTLGVCLPQGGRLGGADGNAGIHGSFVPLHLWDFSACLALCLSHGGRGAGLEIGQDVPQPPGAGQLVGFVGMPEGGETLLGQIVDRIGIERGASGDPVTYERVVLIVEMLPTETAALDDSAPEELEAGRLV